MVAAFEVAYRGWKRDPGEKTPGWQDLEHSLIFNTSGQSYRALGAAAVKAMTRDQALQALASDGKLIKRPFLRGPDGRYLTGFKPEVWEAELLG